jgi:hypothetical protein
LIDLGLGGVGHPIEVVGRAGGEIEKVETECSENTNHRDDDQEFGQRVRGTAQQTRSASHGSLPKETRMSLPKTSLAGKLRPILNPAISPVKRQFH